MIFKKVLQEWSFTLQIEPGIARRSPGGSGCLRFFGGLVL
jgi:hypothetical protein